MPDHDARSGARGDEADLYRAHNDQLMRTVAGAVVGSAEVVEDACSFAWAQFMEHQPDRERNWQGWLFRTAQREAWRLHREVREHRPLRTSDNDPVIGFGEPVDPHDYQAIHTDVGDALSIIERLPPRLQRVAMLRALGLRYSDIGEVTGDSPTRVTDLVARANFQIGEILGERTFREQGASPRAERLWELEHQSPEWLVDKLGPPPRTTLRRMPQGEHRRAWRRAALALDDLRTLASPEHFEDALTTRPREPELQRAHDLARRAVDVLEYQHSPERGRHIGD